MTQRASGTFDVKLSPQPLFHATQDPSLGRMSIDIRDGQHFYGFDYSIEPA